MQISFVPGAQHLQPGESSNVIVIVDTLKTRDDVNMNACQGRFVRVAPPTVHAGVGNALRQAFGVDRDARSFKQFDALLARLD